MRVSASALGVQCITFELIQPRPGGLNCDDQRNYTRNGMWQYVTVYFSHAKEYDEDKEKEGIRLKEKDSQSRLIRMEDIEQNGSND